MIIKKKGVSFKPLSKKVVGTFEKGITLTLPEEISHPSNNIGDYSILLYGEKKIGKTSMSSKFKGSLFFMFEPGAKALSVYQRTPKDWGEFKQYVDMAVESKRFSTIVIDPVDLAYKSCSAYVCKKLGIKHASDSEWGKGWEAIRDEFTSVLNKLLQKGVILISHATEKEIKTRTGDTYHKIAPTMSNQAREVLEGIVDIWAYYSYDGSKRTLTIQGNDHIGAGHRIEKHFLYTDGTPIGEISMGTSSDMAYENFMKAFENKLEKGGSGQGASKPKTKLIIRSKK